MTYVSVCTGVDVIHSATHRDQWFVFLPDDLCDKVQEEEEKKEYGDEHSD